jgi:hypothetical protein
MKETREERYWKARMMMIWRMMMQKNRRNMASYVFEFLTSRDWYRPVPSRTFPLLVWHSLACVCRVQTPLSSLGMKQLGALPSGNYSPRGPSCKTDQLRPHSEAYARTRSPGRSPDVLHRAGTVEPSRKPGSWVERGFADPA